MNFSLPRRNRNPKLYLSSVGLPHAGQFAGLFTKKERRIVIVPTACNDVPEKQQHYIQERTQQLTALDFTVEVLDIAAFKGTHTELAAKLAMFNGAWVLGGNTFYLNYWLRESEFDTILPDLLKNGFVFGGESAGAVVAGKTLHGVELLDDPSAAPEIVWEGLGLVDYSILPHKGNPEYAATYDQAYEEMRLFTPVKTLSDDNFIVTK